MIDRDREHTEEHKDDNVKTVTVGGEEKLLLMDDEMIESDVDLQEMIESLVAECVAAVMGEMDEDIDPLDSQAADVRRAKKHAGRAKAAKEKKARAKAGKATQADLGYDDDYWAELESFR